MRLIAAFPSFLKLPNRFAATAWSGLALVGLSPVLVALVAPTQVFPLFSWQTGIPAEGGAWDILIAYGRFAVPALLAVNLAGALALVLALAHVLAWGTDRLGDGLAAVGLARGDARAAVTGLVILLVTGLLWTGVMVDTGTNTDALRANIEATAARVWPALDEVLRREGPPASWPMPAGDPGPTLEALLGFPAVAAAYHISADGHLTLLERGKALERLDLATWRPERLTYRVGGSRIPAARLEADHHGRVLDHLAFGAGNHAPYRAASPTFAVRVDQGPLTGYGVAPVMELGSPDHARLGFVLDRLAVVPKLHGVLRAAGIPGYPVLFSGYGGTFVGESMLVERARRELDARPDWRTVAIAVDKSSLLDALEGRQQRALITLSVIILALGALLIELTRQVRGLWAERTLALAQSNFVSGVSHEMRTPLATIKLYTELLQGGVAEDPATKAELLGTIGTECDRLSRLIENVLDFARMSGRRKRYVFAAEDARALVDEAVAAVAGPLAASGLALERHVPDGLAFHADRDAVVQTLVNLLSNAIKYAPAGGCILLTCAPSGPDHVEFLVRDFGPGIPEAERKHVFRPFYRVGSELTRTATGSGLGLALVQGHVTSHGGRVDLEDTPGGGATFRVVLPRVPQQRKGASS